MAAMYETFWHAIIVGPILLLIAIVEFFLTIVRFCTGPVEGSTKTPWEPSFPARPIETTDDAPHSR